MIKLISAGKALVVALIFVLAACDSSSSGRVGAANDGRLRLSASNSYGEFANHVVHINGMTTASLTPEIAQSYDIVRSENRGLVNLVVLQKPADGEAADSSKFSWAGSRPVKATVEVSAANLTGQVKPVQLREIIDGESIYYIGVVSVDNREMINFDFDIVPEGSSQNIPIRFSHKFYTR